MKKFDLILLVHIAAIVVLVNLLGCQSEKGDKAKATAVAAPSKELIQAMIDYCRIGDMPRDKQRDAQKLWGFTNGGDKHVGPIWNRAARDNDPSAIKTVRAAADAAVGRDKCPILDILDRPERVPPQPVPPPNQ